VPDRTFAKFTFFKVDPAWQRRDPEARAEDKREFRAACDDFACADPYPHVETPDAIV